MTRDHATRVEDEEILEQRRQTESKFDVYLRLRAAVEEGDLNKCGQALTLYMLEARVSLLDILAIKGPSGNSLLHVAAGIEKADILGALLENIPEGSAIIVNDQQDTTLHVAARAGRIPTADLLLRCRSIVDMVNDAGNTALHEAVKNCDKDLISLLLDRGSGSVNKKNKESKSPLYLAVETNDPKIMEILMKAVKASEDILPRMEGMSPVHGAVMHRKIDMLRVMLQQKKELFDLTDVGCGTPLHLAAYVNYIKGVIFLVEEFNCSAFVKDEEGYLPIHVACKMGHLETIQVLLERWPYPEELLTFNEGQNILHIGAKYGRVPVVNYILGDPKLEKLINAKDKEGNTPLHLATLQWQLEVLFPLTRHEKVNLELVNYNNLAALDIVYEQLTKIDAPLRESLTRTILLSAGASRSKDKTICQKKALGLGRDLEAPNLDRLKDQANTRMVVAALVASMTFAAGFSVPGGYNSSDPDAGFAMLLSKPMYDVFVVCNCVSMYSSIIAVVVLLWTQINDSHAVHHALRNTRLPLLIALATMSVAFMAGIYVTTSKHTWIAIFVLIVGITALFIILVLYIALFLPLRYNCPLIQLFSDFIIKTGISISTGVTQRGNTGWARFKKHGEKVGQPNYQAPSKYVDEYYDAEDHFTVSMA